MESRRDVNDVIEGKISRIIECAMRVRRALSTGFLESVYRNALLIELRTCGFHAETEVPVEVRYKGAIVGQFRADIIVDGEIIIELKSVQTLTAAHEAQLVNYLTATGIDNGLLINFGSDIIQIKRKYRLYHPSSKSR